MKQVRMFSRMSEFEAFVNSPDVEIISLDIKAVEQNALFQECFCAVAYFKSVPVAPPHEDKAEETAAEVLDSVFGNKGLDLREITSKPLYAIYSAMEQYASMLKT